MRSETVKIIILISDSDVDLIYVDPYFPCVDCVIDIVTWMSFFSVQWELRSI